jgi:hypothetical protein
LSAWNLDILAGELRALPDVDWQALGFSGPELAALLGLVEPTPKQTSVQFTARTHTCPACGHEF